MMLCNITLSLPVWNFRRASTSSALKFHGIHILDSRVVLCYNKRFFMMRCKMAKRCWIGAHLSEEEKATLVALQQKLRSKAGGVTITLAETLRYCIDRAVREEMQK